MMKYLFLLLFSTQLFALTANQVWRVPNGGTLASWGAINLASAQAVSGILTMPNGGTGLSTLTAGRIPYGNGTSALASGSTLTFDSVTGFHVNTASTIGTSGSSYPSFGYNFNGTASTDVYKYAANDKGSRLSFENGGFTFYKTVTGTAGANWENSGLGTLVGSLSSSGNFTVSGNVTSTTLTVGTSSNISSSSAGYLELNGSRLYPGTNTQAYFYPGFGSGKTLAVGTTGTATIHPIVTGAQSSPSTAAEGGYITAGYVDGNTPSGGSTRGYGFGASGSSGTYTVTFSTAYPTPAFLVCSTDNAGYVCSAVPNTHTGSASAFTVTTSNCAGTANPCTVATSGFSFIAYGERPN